MLPSRSLSFRLTLAFLVVGLIGAALVAVFVGLRTQTEFDRFVLDRFQVDLIEQLQIHYAENGDWSRIEAIVIRDSHGYSKSSAARAAVTLVGVDGRVVYSGHRFSAGQTLSRRDLEWAVPIEVDGRLAGWVLFDPSGSKQALPASPEADYLGRVNQALLFGALGATAVALLLGILLARTISRPVHALTTATQIVARGELGHQVEVRTDDELGRLAASFNRMSADLARASELRRQMTADVAHELRTPLSVILGYTEALADDKLHGTAALFGIMHDEALRLQRLIDDLRTLSLADAGELSLALQPVSPRELLQRAAATYGGQAQNQGIQIEVESAPELPDVKVDPERMAQVLGNLISNAIRYTPAGGRITLATRAHEDRVILSVQDTGSGIAPEELPHVFERFYQGNAARTPEEGESGLGLAIARSIVLAHGGVIDAASTPGAGTTITIALPQNGGSTAT